MKTRLTYWRCQILGWGAYTAIGIMNSPWRVATVAGYLLFFLYSIALTDLLRREIRRRDWLSELNAKAYLRLFLAAAVVSGIQAGLVAAVDLAFIGKSSEFLIHPWYILAMCGGLCGADGMWLLFYMALTSNRRFQEKEVRLQLAVRDAELRALEAQVNPHFLFNCLNSIRAMVAENPALAQDMITRFATILRYNLQRDWNHTVPLSTEVEVVSDYLALEAIRFEDRLRVQVAIDPAAANAGVPPMLLQTLVENALKHGIAHLPEGGEVDIAGRMDAGGLLLEVANSGHLNGAASGTQLGLANARERLRLLYGSGAALQVAEREGRVVASVRIPKTL